MSTAEFAGRHKRADGKRSLVQRLRGPVTSNRKTRVGSRDHTTQQRTKYEIVDITPRHPTPRLSTPRILAIEKTCDERTLCAYTGLPSTTNVTSERSWLSSSDRMSDMNDDDIELNAGVDKLAPARAAVCSLYDATCRAYDQSKSATKRGGGERDGDCNFNFPEVGSYQKLQRRDDAYCAVTTTLHHSIR